MSGGFTFTGTITGNTSVTFPTSGTLATTAAIPSFPLSLANGGTNASLAASNGGIVYSNASAFAVLAGTATANLPLLSGSSTTPSWGAFALSLGGALTTAGALTTSGAFGATFTFTGTTSVTFPTSGTLATTAGTVTSLTGTANQISVSAATGAVTISMASNPTIPGNTGMIIPTGSSGSRPGAGNFGRIRGNTSTGNYELDDGSAWRLIPDAPETITSRAIPVFTGTNDPSLSNTSVTISSGGDITATSIIFNPTTGGILGTTTNNNASAGYVGEFVSSEVLIGSAVSISANTATDLTSISLTAGDWDVWANVGFTPDRELYSPTILDFFNKCHIA